MIDKLSGFYEKKAFLAKFDEEFKRAVRYGRPFGFMMMELDHKHFGGERDTRWSMGYSLLKQLAAVLRTGLRDLDVLGRIEGEVFAAALPETDLAGASVVAERVRQVVEEHRFMGTTMEDRVQVAVNVGFGVLPDQGESTDALLESCRKALETARQQGGNKAVLGDKVAVG